MDQGTLFTLKKKSDQASSIVALADVADLVAPVMANMDYLFDFIIIYQSAALTTGIKLAMNCPALGAIAYHVEIAFLNAANGTANIQSQAFVVPDTGLVTPSVDTINVDRLARLWGSLRNGANAGNLVVRVASEVAASAVTVRKGSGGRIIV